MDRTCRRCRAPLRPAARFCPACGAATAEYEDERRAERAARSREARRVAAALFVVLAGSLAAVLTHPVEEPDAALPVLLRFQAVLVAVGALGAAVAGRGALRASLAGPASAPALGLGLLTGLLWLGLNLLYVGAVRALAGAEPAPAPEPVLPLSTALLLLAVLPALGEEWLCRGVLWTAVRRAVPPAGAVLVTAALFGVLHGLQGWVWLPHRFLGGVLLGLLRLRTGSLLPGILAHLANNALVVLLV